MNRTATRLAVLFTGALLPGRIAFAQDDELRAEWKRVQSRLDAKSADERRLELLAFLRNHPTTARQALPLLEAHCRLGSLYLTAFDPGAAQSSFLDVMKDAPKSAIDLRGHALCGLAECAELVDDREGALEFWNRAAQELAGTPWSDVARVARARLSSGPRTKVRAGQTLPEVGPMLDTTQSARRLGDLRGEVALLIFFSCADQEGMSRLARVVAAARDAGVRDTQMLAFAIEVQGRNLDELSAKHGLSMPVIASPDGFLGPALLQLEVRSVPSSLLVGPDGTLIGRDLPPVRIKEILGEPRKR